jgi:hypothetical protein
MVSKLQQMNEIAGWRKLHHWRKDLKNKMRALGRASSSGGKGKQDRVELAVKSYLLKSKALLKKLETSKEDFPQQDIASTIIVMQLEYFMELLLKHIDLLERRLVKGEEIPHREKMFSIFEQYTEWVAKGKKRPSVELGKKAGITTDQYNLIVDYQVMEHQSDSEAVPGLVKRMAVKYRISSWSFDKGYWHKDNKALLLTAVKTPVLPKKGKCNTKERQEQQKAIFKKLRNKHSAIESNINELEHRGLDRCPDRGYNNFKRYIGLAVCAYNLRKIGVELIRQTRTAPFIEDVPIAA